MDPGSHRPLRVGVTSTHCPGRRFCTFPLSRDVLLAPSRVSREDVAASHSPRQLCCRASTTRMAADSPAAKEHPLEVSTIRSLTLSGNKSAEISTDGSGHSDAIDRHWELADRAPSPEKHCLQNERERILRRAIHALRPSMRGVVEMQQLQEHSMRETARLMGVTVAAAKARLFHARVMLRKDSGLRAIARTRRKSERN